MAPAVAVAVQYASRARFMPPRPAVEGWVRAALRSRRAGAELTVRIVGREEGRRLNEGFRGRAAPTNVLSFPFEAPPGAPATGELGDVVLCAPVVNREARTQGKPRADHWAHLVVHGVLHLLGFDHDRPDAARRMEGLERRILAGLGIPDPYERRPAARPPAGRRRGRARDGAAPNEMREGG